MHRLLHRSLQQALLLGSLMTIWAAPAEAALIINEIDYDQPGSDRAEFVELLNTGPALDLAGYALEFINGSTGSTYRRFALGTNGLAAGGYLVLCGDAGAVPNCDLDVSPDRNLIQNGAPDAVALLLAGVVVNAASYEGSVAPPYVEGSGSGLADPSGINYLGLSRWPNGADSGNNRTDFSVRCITPGSANRAATGNCPTPAAHTASSSVPEPGTLLLILTGTALVLFRTHRIRRWPLQD
jgi:hypothetical protein